MAPFGLPWIPFTDAVTGTPAGTRPGFTVPNGEIWHIYQVFCILITSATSVNRQVFVSYQPATGPALPVGVAPNVQGAGVGTWYVFIPGSGGISALGMLIWAGPFVEVIMTPGDQIFVDAINFQGNDQFSFFGIIGEKLIYA